MVTMRSIKTVLNKKYSAEAYQIFNNVLINQG
jgi:hypothetical protein